MKPEREIVSFVATDAGFVNYQLECGHVYWMWPKKRSYANQLQEVQEKHEDPRRAVLIPCEACEAGAPLLYPVGTPLPLPNPVLHNPEWAEIMESIIQTAFEEDVDVRKREWLSPETRISSR